MHDNLGNLGLDVLEVVNLRIMLDPHRPAEGSVEAPLAMLAELQRQGLVRHIGLSNVTPAQVAEARRICNIVCVQNHYNLAHRADDPLIGQLAREGIAYVPFFPLGGFSPLQSSTLSNVAARLHATPMQLALAWLFRRAPNILLIPGTSSVAHLHENLAATELNLPDDAMTSLNEIGELGSVSQQSMQRHERREGGREERTVTSHYALTLNACCGGPRSSFARSLLRSRPHSSQSIYHWCSRVGEKSTLGLMRGRACNAKVFKHVARMRSQPRVGPHRTVFLSL